jgi:DnaJ homologue, subfamily C, member 28, conserved domain
MTERKPPGTSFTSWIDRQISEAAQRGAFDDLPGAGKPLPKGDGADEGQAWLREYLRREGVSAEELLPAPLRLRKEVERLTGTVHDLGSEQEVRDTVTELNRRIIEWRRIPEGPPVFLRLVDEDMLVRKWHDGRATSPRPPSAPPTAPAALAPAGWWRRLRRRRQAAG